MSFLVVFGASVLMTVIVGAFIPFTWQAARNFRAAAVYWGVALLVHGGWCLVPVLGSVAPIARWIVVMWLGGMLAAMVLLIPFALLAVFFESRQSAPKPACLAAIYAGCFVLSGFVLAFTSTAEFVVRQEDIRITGLPPALDGFRIANIGDVHIGRFIDAKELRRGIEAINQQHVDLLTITGDFVDDANQLEGAMQALEASNAPNKTIAILGNHEAMGDLSRIIAIYREHAEHITLLVNQNLAIEHGGATLRIVGVDFPTDPTGRRKLPKPAQDAAMLAQANTAFAGIAPGETILALAHNPEFFPFAAAHGAQLTLASHTHGGQLRLFGRPILSGYPYLQGPFQLGTAQLDVSAGFGHWLPIRFGAPREIVIDTLRRSD